MIQWSTTNSLTNSRYYKGREIMIFCRSLLYACTHIQLDALFVFLQRHSRCCFWCFIYWSSSENQGAPQDWFTERVCIGAIWSNHMPIIGYSQGLSWTAWQVFNKIPKLPLEANRVHQSSKEGQPNMPLLSPEVGGPRMSEGNQKEWCSWQWTNGNVLQHQITMQLPWDIFFL